MKAILSLCAVLLGACAATPPAETPPPVAGETRYETVQQASAAAKDDDVICSNEKVVGSRMEKRVCMTRHEREMATKRSKEDLERAATRGAAQIPGR